MTTKPARKPAAKKATKKPAPKKPAKAKKVANQSVADSASKPASNGKSGGNTANKPQHPGRDANGRIMKGTVLNPKGRPRGSRQKLSEEFITALSEDFSEHGVQAIRTLRETDVSKYVSVVAQLTPRDVHVEHSGDATFAQLWKLIGAGALAGPQVLTPGDDYDGDHLH